MKIQITGNVIGIEIGDDGIADVDKKEAARLLRLGVARRVSARPAQAKPDDPAGNGQNPASGEGSAEGQQEQA